MEKKSAENASPSISVEGDIAASAQYGAAFGGVSYCIESIQVFGYYLKNVYFPGRMGSTLDSHKLFRKRNYLHQSVVDINSE